MQVARSPCEQGARGAYAVVAETNEYPGFQKGKTIVRVEPRYFRPTEVESLLGDPSKARKKLGWKPRIGFGELVADMIRGDLELARRDRVLSEEGIRVFNYHE